MLGKREKKRLGFPTSTFPEESSVPSQMYERPHKETERGQEQIQLHLSRTCRHQGCLTSLGERTSLSLPTPMLLLHPTSPGNDKTEPKLTLTKSYFQYQAPRNLHQNATHPNQMSPKN